MADFILSPVIRGQRLEESLEYQQFVANVEEEEAWINEKMTLVASEDYGDTLAAIQVRETGGAACCSPRRPRPRAAACPTLFLPACSVAVLFPGEHSEPAAGVSLAGLGPQDPTRETLPLCRQNWGDFVSPSSWSPAVSPAVWLVSLTTGY